MTKTLRFAMLSAMSVTLTGGAALLTAPQAAAADLRVVPAQAQAFVLVSDENTAKGAESFIAKMGERGINFLGDTSKSNEAKAAEFSKLLNDSFDMNTIGRFSLGPHWRNATPAQQQEYLKLFNDMIVKVYSRRFSDYEGQKFEVRSSRKENDRDTMVTSFIVPSSGPNVRVDWRVRQQANGSYKVVDIMVEGVSMAMTQRADFSSVIQRGGGDIEALLKHLRGA